MKNYHNFAFTEIKKEFISPEIPSLPYVLCTLGTFNTQPKTVRKKGFKFNHILWVTNGVGKFEMNGEEFVLKAGEGVFFKRSLPHKYEAKTKEFSTAWLTFLCDNSIFDYFKVSDWFKFPVTPTLLAYAKELEMLCCKSSSIITRSAVGYSGLVEWLTEISEPYLEKTDTIRQFLEAHFSKPLTLEDIANEVGIDKFSLCRYYKNQTGITVMEQLKLIRIAKAKQLLAYTDYRSLDIAKMCGFDSPSYFTKLFKIQTGQTPKGYREIHKKGM